MGRGYSITALVLSCIFFIPLAPIVGLIMSIVGLVKGKGDSTDRVLFIVGTCMGAFMTLFNLAFTLGFVLSLLRNLGAI
jgi:hypothetical protein